MPMFRSFMKVAVSACLLKSIQQMWQQNRKIAVVIYHPHMWIKVLAHGNWLWAKCVCSLLKTHIPATASPWVSLGENLQMAPGPILTKTLIKYWFYGVSSTLKLDYARLQVAVPLCLPDPTSKLQSFWRKIFLKNKIRWTENPFVFSVFKCLLLSLSST